jgi:hypothetical protein
MNASPSVLTSYPPCRCNVDRITASWARSALRASSGRTSHRRVDPWMSVNTSVTRPTGALRASFLGRSLDPPNHSSASASGLAARRFGSTSSAARTASAHRRGASSSILRRSRYWPARTAANTLSGSSPSNGSRPVARWYRITPSDHTSARWSTASLSTDCSGAMNSGVPKTRGPFLDWRTGSPATRASVKSVILGHRHRPREVDQHVAGLQVPVDHTVAVQPRGAVEQARGDGVHLGLGQVVRLDHVAEVGPLDVVEHDGRDAVDQQHVGRGDHVGVPQPGLDPGAAREAGPHHRRRGVGRPSTGGGTRARRGARGSSWSTSPTARGASTTYRSMRAPGTRSTR